MCLFGLRLKTTNYSSCLFSWSHYPEKAPKVFVIVIIPECVCPVLWYSLGRNPREVTSFLLGKIGNWTQDKKCALPLLAQGFSYLTLFPHVLERSLMVKWSKYYMTNPYWGFYLREASFFLFKLLEIWILQKVTFTLGPLGIITRINCLWLLNRILTRTLFM